MKKIFFILSVCLVFSGCNTGLQDRQTQLCPLEIRNDAYDFAIKYRDENAGYEWGGQDPLPRTIKVDCSGLVVRCYQYALEKSDFELPFNDASSTYMYKYYSTKTDSPQKGDLVFMGDKDSSEVSHVGLVNRIENQTLYFIDSTSLDNLGVSERNYPVNNPKIKGYGIMNVVKRH